MFASGFYFQGTNAPGALTFNTQDLTSGTATLQTVSDVIGDDTGSAAAAGYTGPNSYAPGSVGLVKTGIGTLDLTAANTYTGGTTITGGTLQLGDGNTTGSIVGGITDGGTLAFDEAAATPLTFSGIISDNGGTAGAVTQIGGTTTLSAANTYSGGTLIQSGVLTLDDVSNPNIFDGLGSIGSTVTLDGGALELKGSGYFARYVINTIVGSTSKFLVTSGNNISLPLGSDSSLNLADQSTLFFGSAVDNGTITFRTHGSISSSAAIEVGGGTLQSADSLLTLTTSVVASTTVDANATLDLNNDSTTVRNLQGNATSASIKTGTSTSTLLTVDAGSFAGVISGLGKLNKTTTGILVLSGTNIYTGGTAVNGGTLELGQQSSAGTGAITFGAGAQTLRLDFAGTTAAPDALAAPVMGFTAGDNLDLTAVSFAATDSYANGVLTVSDGTNTDKITIAAAPLGDEYQVSNDGNNHALVTLAAIPTPTFVTPAQNSDTNNNKPTISGTGVSGDTVNLTISNGSGNPTAVVVPVVNGVWTYTPTLPLADGNHAVFASQSSPSGNGTSPQVADGFEVDTTAPVASSPTLTVAQNSAATPIGIAAPSDNLTAAGSLAIVAGALPTDGTVTLADGTTRVTAGDSLTAAQLTGLEFTPYQGAFGQGSTFAYTVTDGAGNATTGTAALNVGSPGAPTITGTHATATTSEAAVTPFSGVIVADPSAATETLTIALTGAGGTLTGAGLTANTNGSYSLTGSAATVTQQLDALSFPPTAGAAGTTSTTTFVLTDASTAGTSVTNAGTSVTDTDPAVPVQPTPPPVVPDAVSIDPAVTYSRGVFTLTGTASSAAGVSSVEISAQVDGVATDLGAAMVNANGTFMFADRIGPHTQGFITATETDGAGLQTVSADPGFSLTGGLDQGTFRASQTSYTDGGMEEASTSLFRAGGSRKVDVQADDQTLTSDFFDTFNNHGDPGNTFVFNPGHGLDIVNQFRVNGVDHDGLSFLGSDFGSTPAAQLAAVLQNASNGPGGVTIMDPTSGDTVRLAGVTKAQLVHNKQDFTFHA